MLGNPTVIPGRYVDPGAWRHAIAKSDLSPSARHVTHALALYVPRGHRSTFVGVRKLAAATGYARNTVLRALDELRAGGWIVEDEAPRGAKVRRYPTLPSGVASETPSGALTEPLSDPESGSMGDEGGALADTSGAMADTSGALTEPYLKENSETTQRRTPEPPARCVCQRRKCGRMIEHKREYDKNPAAFLAKHLGASMELSNAR